ncbi:lipopolysaccharide biosynthesis protein [Sphingobacterium sp. lm-10]|uniref:lipopolysaccharide biosynthesis protein n=1 Tax=Sphingobacterium sp. lm-10 TaxID=2944904 RepID=UPI00201FEA19|nr:lipopolysaccharide biosynthesis protein [Sphingobacterium sp. lm-10]MCL7988616.1 lipopolysaccharide biosynthesis protein [Sphingobacterium sp. lm-10]
MEKSQDEIALKDLFIYIGKGVKYLLSKWYIILVFALLGSAAGYYLAKSKEVLYTGTTTFILEGNNAGSASGLAALGGMAAGGIGGADGLFQGESLFELYKSRSILRKTLMRKIDTVELFVQKFYQINKDFRESLEERPELAAKITDTEFFLAPDSLESRTRDSILLRVCDKISESYIEVDKLNKKANLIYVTVSAEDEVFAKRFNEELVNNVNEFYLETKGGISRENIATLQLKVDSVRRAMSRSISSSQSVTDYTPNLNPTRQSLRSIPLQEAQLSTESSRGVLAELTRNLEQAKIALSKEAPIIKIVDEVMFPLPINRASMMLFSIGGAFLSVFLVTLVLSTIKIIRHILK